MKIAIIGSGVSGSTVLKTLIQSQQLDETQDSIHIFDKRLINGKGMPYQADVLSLKMNTASHFLSADLDDREQFTRYLKAHHPDWNSDGEGLIPRPYYGEYLAEHFSPYYADKLVHKHQKEIVDLAVSSDTPYCYQLKTATGEWLEQSFDSVFLAIGHPPYADYYHLDGQAHFIKNPYPFKEKLSQLPRNKRVGVTGSGASGLDVLRYYDDEQPWDYPMTFYVRNHPFASTGVPASEEDVHVSIDEDWLARQKANYGSLIPLDVMLDTVAKDFKQLAINWQAIVREYGSGHFSENIRVYEKQPKELARLTNYFDQITANMPDLYQSLSETDKSRFNKEYASYYDHFRSPVPSGTMTRIKKLLMQDKLRIVSGLSDIKLLADGSFMIYCDGQPKEKTDYLINATGFNHHLDQAGPEQSLVFNLYNKGYFMPKYQGKDITVTWPETQVINARYGLMENLFVSGHYIFSTQYRNNNAQLIVKQARRMTQYYLKRVKG